MVRRLTAERLNELAKLISDWAKLNFNNPPYHLPAMGFLEELGEAVHCLLKRKQMIRGFEDEAYFKEHLGDALADAMIYMLNMCGILGFKFPGGSLLAEEQAPIQNERHAIHVLCMCVTDFVDPERNDSAMIQSVIDSLEALATIAHIHGIDFDETVEQTWEKVGKRDWVKNPKDAHKVADAKAPDHKPGKKK